MDTAMDDDTVVSLAAANSPHAAFASILVLMIVVVIVMIAGLGLDVQRSQTAEPSVAAASSYDSAPLKSIAMPGAKLGAGITVQQRPAPAIQLLP